VSPAAGNNAEPKVKRRKAEAELRFMDPGDPRSAPLLAMAGSDDESPVGGPLASTCTALVVIESARAQDLILSEGDHLDQIARKINSLAAKLNAHGASARALQIMTGLALLAAKKLLPHGEFEAWADANLAIGKSWRNILMRLAKASGSIDEALKWAADTNSKVEVSARGMVDLVTCYRNADKGEISAPAQKSKTETAAEKLTRLEAENGDLRAAVEAEKIRADKAVGKAAQLEIDKQSLQKKILSLEALLRAANGALKRRKGEADPRQANLLDLPPAGGGAEGGQS
jgi:hypothetical protein